MDKEFLERILLECIRLVKEGKQIPIEWSSYLFPVLKKEYELVYAGKKSEEQILSEVQSVPLQPFSKFGA